MAIRNTLIVTSLWMTKESSSSAAFTFLPLSQPHVGRTRPTATGYRRSSAFFAPPTMSTTTTTRLWDGRGVATNYSWSETAFEMELSFRVPPKTRSRDVLFRCKPKTLDLQLKHPNGTVAKVLLDVNREVRGKIGMDGTFWGLSDDADGTAKERNLTVYVEKSHLASNKYDYDWGGLYPDDDEEVIERDYPEPEELDVRDYAAKMGVDIDNINMSWVDKDMFSLRNMTKKNVNKMIEQGLLKEVTEQVDGDSVVDEDGFAKPYNSFGPNIGQDEIAAAEERNKKIPFVDTDSPWGKTVPVERTEDGVQIPEHARKQIEEYAAQKKAEAEIKQKSKKKTSTSSKRKVGRDPIEGLTVKRLKAILKKEGLKVSGKKEELKARLRQHIQSLAKEGVAKRQQSLQD